MHPSDKKKVITLIIVVIVLIALGVGLAYWQKQSPEISTNTNENYEQLNNEQKEKLAQATKKVKDNPESNIALIELARIQTEFRWHEEAIATYNKALELAPLDPLALNNLSNIYFTLEQYEKTEELLLKIINSNPRAMLQSYTDLADLYRYQLPEKRDKTPEILLKGLEHNPEKQELFLRYLAVYHKDFGDKQKAVEYYEKLLEVEPDNETARTELEQLQAE